MAERRMFAKSIVLSDAFLDMPMSARCLYFTLNMFADDDGFVGSPKGIMRQCGASEDDIKLLIAKKFVLAFESGVIVIKHWRINNYLQNDRKKDTTYLDEVSQITIKKDRSYTWSEKVEKDSCIQNVYNLDTQNSIDKNSIDKNSIVEVVDNKNYKVNNILRDPTSAQMQQIIDIWNSQKVTQKINKIPFGNYRYTNTLRCIDNDIDSFINTIKDIDNQAFFQKQFRERNPIKYDWFVDPNNYIKVVEGNYKNLIVKETAETEQERKLRMIMEG